MNRDLAVSPGALDQLSGVIESYELAFRMQSKVPELLDLSRELEHVRDAYGVQDGPGSSFARQCLMARRLGVTANLLAPPTSRRRIAQFASLLRLVRVGPSTPNKLQMIDSERDMTVKRWRVA